MGRIQWEMILIGIGQAAIWITTFVLSITGNDGLLDGRPVIRDLVRARNAQHVRPRPHDPRCDDLPGALEVLRQRRQQLFHTLGK